MKEKYAYHDYSKNYKLLFKEEKKNLKTFLKGVKIEHVGSTAIPGMGGKKVIDIIVGVKKKFGNEKELLKMNGYEFEESGGTAQRLFFKKIIAEQLYHLHLVVYDELDWLQTTAFRDYLIENPSQIKEYEKVKKEAVKVAKGSGEMYRNHKKNYLDKVTKIALRQSAKLY
ncbi:MAG: GrpB family protein [Candidatus Diapherotrites archaeon]|jgi:GrpB-like predicted nucleotidyltransferase (UPF0157 family)|uniref:GrpB family protein n=1 Tax=Candidatus Iainarchaeum sp. TaxID=3101447 RepID=A0A8T5GGZ2_9ARCH|nr:GrpB family protein [Candidatus Diapherotrites archaeon]MBT7241663.1 GrpB family protein [Candidatus Diapherotrites archaeon]